MPDLEERVAALEAALIMPIQASEEVWTDEQVAEFRELFAEAAERHEMRILPSPPPLTPEQVRYLLRECVTVVKPGETLIIRVPLTWTPAEVDRYTLDIGAESEAMDLPFKTVVVAAEELGIAEPGGVPGAA